MWAISAGVNAMKPQLSDQASLKIEVTVSNSSRYRCLSSVRTVSVAGLRLAILRRAAAGNSCSMS